MATIMRVKARWSGFAGSPGYSNFYFRDFSSGAPTDADADAAADRVETFFQALPAYLTNATRITVQSDAEVIEETNGEIVSVLNAGARVAIAGTGGTGGYSAASGAVVTWRTGGVVAGRRVRGRTFLVPLAASAYGADGTITTGLVGTLQTAGAALISIAGSPDVGVWARPHKQHVNKAGETIPARDGSWWAATSVTVPTKVAVLRSRRD